MARSITVDQGIRKIKARLDEDDCNYLTTDFLVECLDSARAEVYDILTTKWENYNIAPYPITLSGTNQDYDLPDDFYKLVDVFVTTQGGYRLDRLDLQDAIRASTPSCYQGEGYILLGDQIRISTYQGSGSVELWYTPCAEVITDTDQVIDGINGWEELMILIAMKKALVRGEKPTQVVDTEMARQFQRLENMASGRDGSQPKSVKIVNRGRRY